MNTKTLFLIVFFIFIGLVIYYFYPEQKIPANASIDKLVIYKSKRQMLVFSGNEVLKVYSISLGASPKGKKEFENDNKTPEGNYIINDKSSFSRYHKNLSVSYPGKEDIINANKQNKKPGGEIKIHGLPNGMGFFGKFQRWYDWTAGCIALTNEEIDELYASVKLGAKIEIYP